MEMFPPEGYDAIVIGARYQTAGSNLSLATQTLFVKPEDIRYE